MGLPLLESDGEEEEDKETNVESITADSDVVANNGDEKDNLNKEKEKPKRFGVREWDRGKVGYMRWIEAQREERDEQFAPPTSYESNKRKR